MLDCAHVLEHVENDAGAIAEFARVLKPGGIAAITVPALQILWSDWDESLHHFRRYSREDFLRLIRTPPFSIEHWNFINVLALPAVFLSQNFALLLVLLIEPRTLSRRIG